jgi:uncharacterized protein with HEPN domain
MRRDEDTILDIIAAAREAIGFADGLTLDRFATDRRTLMAVLHEISIIGEAAKRLSAPFRRAHPEIPWSDIAGMRDRLIHGYDSVDITVVWETLTRDLPRLVSSLEQITRSGPGFTQSQG